MIVSGTTSQSLSAALATEMGRELAPLDVERFPDGELLVGVPHLDADEVVIVAATTSAAAHIELLQLQDAVREAGADHIETVIPYMGYARQDKPMAPDRSLEASPSGYPVSARAVARALSSSTDRVLVVTPHEPGVIDHFDVPAQVIDGAAELAMGLPEALHDPLFVSPDEGARDKAAAVKERYGVGDVDHFVKTRIDPETVSQEPNETDPSGRDVVIVDDIIATGGTAAGAVELLHERSANQVFVACVHAVLAETARTKLARAGVADIIATDTVEGPASRVSVAGAIANHLETNGKG